jgi:predicted nucleotide-binding protein (sugar kinase/HSP70/actin superfamily)
MKVEKAFLNLGAKKTEFQRNFQRSAPEAWAAAADGSGSGIPKVLNIWTLAPFFRTYLETLGLQKQNVVFSDETSEEMWLEGGKYGSIDPCYPSKVAQAHIHNLLFHHHQQEEGGRS